jgi:hypothetical protein
VTDPFAEFDAPTPADSATDEAVADEAAQDPIAHQQRRRRWPGIWSFWIAIAMVIVTAVAIGLEAYGESVTALTLTISALGLSAIAFVLGLVAIFGNFSRMWGIIGAAIALVVNPVALLYGLVSLGAL